MSTPLDPKKEPKDAHLVEISDDKGNHVVVNLSSEDDALDVEGLARRVGKAETDKDEQLSRLGRAGSRQYDSRDHDKLRVRSGPVVNPNADLEAEEDDDSTFDGNRDDDMEPDEVVADGPWSGKA